MTPSTTPERQPDESPQRRMALTPHQKRLLAELREIAAITRLDYPDIRGYDPEERTARLKLMKDQLVRSQVIMDYFVDEMLTRCQSTPTTTPEEQMIAGIRSLLAGGPADRPLSR